MYLVTLLALSACAIAQSILDALPANQASLLWGPYRPNVYVGIRPIVPESLFMGLMWGNFDEGHKSLRHTCEQNDGMAGYGWTAYDARSGGSQLLPDVGNKFNITTEFVKIGEGQSRGNWGLRIKGTPREGAGEGLRTSLVFYVAMEATGTCGGCRLEAADGKIKLRDDKVVKKVVFWTKHPKLGISQMEIHIPEHEITAVKSMNTTEDVLWKSKSLFVNTLKQAAHSEHGQLVIPNEPGVGNIHFVQMVFKDDFKFDILYSSQEATREMTSLDITSELETTITSFVSRFATIFKPTSPFNLDTHIAFGQSLLSNLLGGLGYFYGDAKVDESHAPEYEESRPNFWVKIAELRKQAEASMKGPRELLTHVPSRSKFPRGFLWDEGFHLLPVMEWDADLGLDVLQSWLALIDGDGWIAREQILGPEARSKVPEDFQTQAPQIANPPTMFWIAERYVDFLTKKKKYVGYESTYLNDKEMARGILESMYTKLKLQYDWFRRTQSGDVEPHSVPRAVLSEGYRWRGRTPGTNFASGLDDYPRAEPPDVSELHVDALCWVGVMAKVLTKIAEYIHRDEHLAKLQSQYKAISQNLETVHWSEEDQTFCDTRVWNDIHTFTCPKGYVSIFPLITGFLGPEHPRLNATLDLIRDPEHLWSEYGVRSLSPKEILYGKGDDYWRGAIWININYLVLEQLLHLAKTPGPLKSRCREIYTELRENIVMTVYKSWEVTGFAWEQYNPDNGQGQRTQHFTGWTALVVQIMALPDLRNEEEGVREKIGELLLEVKENRRWSTGSVLAGVFLMGFAYMSRRKIARSCRSLTRRRRLN